eukprot:scaffold8990_cov87-Cylindrotheca_fusiformis.AAC.1
MAIGKEPRTVANQGRALASNHGHLFAPLSRPRENNTKPREQVVKYRRDLEICEQTFDYGSIYNH